ncbi:hypothetical protein ACPA0F_18245 [Solibacillus silvestris]
MGRLSNTDQYFYFDSVGYLNEARQAMRAASLEVKELVWGEVKRNISSLPFKENKVPLANGQITRDSDRADALDASVEARLGQYTKSNSTKGYYPGRSGLDFERTVIPINIQAMGKHYKDSHIGWYYEYGTGTLEEVPFSGYWDTDAINPKREGFRSPIVSRPAGTWKDAGGNIRKSRGKGGVRNAAFEKYVGEDVKAHRWFSKALYDNEDKIRAIYLSHMKKVDFKKYMHFKRKIVLGGSKRGG